ncbi:MAG: redox-sensing transcriptional repressor Rex [Armatimonadetes bacterium]|nr:redox-sensing transcriptional repressor Rex [Candidatus Hippobium faecium]
MIEEVNQASVPTLRRLPLYLHYLKQLQSNGILYISSTTLAKQLKFEAIQVRKDLSVTGIVGRPKIGYPVPELIKKIQMFINWDTTMNAVIIGAGALGSALLGYNGFEDSGLKIIAAFDSDPNKIGSIIRGRNVHSLNDLEEFINKNNILVGIITVPAEFAQNICDILVKANIKGVWNFTPAVLETPDNVIVKNQDPIRGLAELTYRLKNIM